MRLGSFAAAANELNVNPTAISHHVKVLEAWVGHRLFARRNNAVLPTAAARMFAPIITEALERIAEGAQTLTGESGLRLLSISVQPDFALKWLVPRLPRFATQHPDVELRLVTGYRSLDFVSENLDLAIRYLDVASPPETGVELRAEPLLRADLIPVASPASLPPDRPADEEWLRGSVLLHALSGPDDWRRWLTAAGVDGVNATRGPKFDSHALTSEAAAQGWGVALGRIGFIETDIATGRLAAPFSLKLPGQRNWVLLSALRSRKPMVAVLRKFLLREADITRTG